MHDRSRFWSSGVYALVMAGCLQFLVLTVAAMFFYPGGTVTNPTTSGYSFSANFFSDLGLTVAHSGEPSAVSAILFFIALVLAGVGLILFFVAFPRSFTASRGARILSTTGSIFGLISGLCFVGVAFTPANLYLRSHVFFVMWAFRAFPLAVLCYGVAIFLQEEYANRYGWVFVAFGALLVAYVALLTAGPALDSPRGITVQALGQKIIVYATVLSIFLQAHGARNHAVMESRDTH